MPYRYTAEPPENVAEWFRAKGLAPGFDWHDVWRDQHQVAFTIAKMTQLDLLQDMHQAMSQAIEEGVSQGRFVREQRKRLREAGWWGKQTRIDPKTGEARRVLLGSPARLRLIYNTNLRTSLAGGQWEHIEETRDTHPYLLYQLGPSKNHRPQHMRWHGTLLPSDDPWWRTHFPPNGWNCRCWVRQVSAEEADRKRWKVSKRPAERYYTTRDPRTGGDITLPEGIQPGWDVSHRRPDRMNGLQQLYAARQRETAGLLGMSETALINLLGEFLEP